MQPLTGKNQKFGIITGCDDCWTKPGTSIMGKLEGKVAIVTGASRGIGKGVAILFASEGAKVVVCGRTLSEGDHPLKGSLNTTVSEIQRAGGAALAVKGDISSEESCAHIVQAARQTWGPVDVLVNNAMCSRI